MESNFLKKKTEKIDLAYAELFKSTKRIKRVEDKLQSTIDADTCLVYVVERSMSFTVMISSVFLSLSPP